MEFHSILKFYDLISNLTTLHYVKQGEYFQSKSRILKSINHIIDILEGLNFEITKKQLKNLRDTKILIENRKNNIKPNDKLLEIIFREVRELSAVLLSESEDYSVFIVYKNEYYKKILKHSISQLDSYFKTEDEKELFKKNLISLIEFQITKNYKFSMIAMGSILEFLLSRYCHYKNIVVSGKNFYNYVQSAIDNNIFGEKKRWELVQSHLRDFRNYVHIIKEIKETKIDQKWYETMKPVFESLYDKFKQNSI